MNKHEENVAGALTGAVAAAAVQWARYDDDTQRRLRNVRDDARATAALLSELQARGEILRSQIPTVNDAQIGIALANDPNPTSPTLLPNATAITRPDVFSNMEVAIADLSWPPQAGVYDAKGMVTKVGELTTTFLTMTFEEVRAFIQGLAQPKAPTRDGKVQVFWAANTLIGTVAGLKLTAQQYADAWARLFGAPTSGTNPPSVVDHTDSSRPPTVASLDAGLTSVVPLGLPEVPAATFYHQNTDAVSKCRITVSAGGIGANIVAVAFNFGNPYVFNGKSYVPTVICNDPRFKVVNTTNSGFALLTIFGLGANAVVDLNTWQP